MSDPFVSEIRIVAGNFAPTGWATCDGQLLPLSQNTALFSLLGTTYGGNGKSNFALPNLQGSAPMHPGQGPGLSLYDLGQTGGSETVTLLTTEIPSHPHSALGSAVAGNQTTPQGNAVAQAVGRGTNLFVNGSAPNVQMNPQSVALAGSSFPHNNMQPYLTLLFIIALQGVFPPRG